jgi:hypothetical protein
MSFSTSEKSSDVLKELTSMLSLGRNRSAAAASQLDAAAPLLIEVLQNDTHQSDQVRQIIWSLYNCSERIALGNLCSGLDLNLAVAVAAAISGRLFMGADVEPILKKILSAAGEFKRFAAAEKQTPEGMRVPYPCAYE